MLRAGPRLMATYNRFQAGGVPEHGVGRVGGNALSGVHGGGVTQGDVFADVLGGEHGQSVIVEAPGGDAAICGVDGVHAPTVAVAHHAAFGLWVLDVAHRNSRIVAAGQYVITDRDAVPGGSPPRPASAGTVS